MEECLWSVSDTAWLRECAKLCEAGGLDDKCDIFVTPIAVAQCYRGVPKYVRSLIKYIFDIDYIFLYIIGSTRRSIIV